MSWTPTEQRGASMDAFWDRTNTSKARQPSPAPPFRKRLQSLPLVGSDLDIVEGVQRLSCGTDNAPVGGTKKMGGIRGLIRKASISIKSRQRRHSHVVEERPQTAWKRLKTAASFHRHSKFLSVDLDRVAANELREDTNSPIHRHPSAPLIPLGGDAARYAAAAQQNEYLGRNRQLLLPDEQFEDQESGIGIAVTSTSCGPVDFSDDTTIISGISRVDFISNLPAELAIYILAHLNHDTLRNASRVSRQWFQISQTQSIWREVFLREQTRTYATSKSLALGAGLGLPPAYPDNDWKDLYRIREQLRHNWLAGTAEAVYLNGHLDSIYCVQFDENKIITGSRDKTIRIWDMRTYACTLIIGPQDVVQSSAMKIGEDGRPVHYATLPDLSRSAESMPLTVSFDIHHNQSILCLQYDENILVTGSSDSTCIMYDVNDWYRPIMRLRHHTAAVLDLAFDERHIVTCSKDVSICVWDRATGVMLKQLRGHMGPVNAVQLRGNTIVSCSGDFKVKLWNIDTGKNFRELLGHTKGLACSQFSDDSRFIASAGNDKIIRIWDANTGECMKSIAAHDNLVRSLHIDSVSGRLVSGSYDQDIKVFDMATGALLLDFPKWHSSWVLGAKSDYRRIISTGQDPKILIMDFGMKVRGISKLESGRLPARPWGPG